MSYISKKKIKEIEFLSFWEDILKEKGYDFFEGDNNPGPDSWYETERELFDIVTSIEERFRQAIFDIINNKEVT